MSFQTCDMESRVLESSRAGQLDDLERHRLLDDVLERAAEIELRPSVEARPRRWMILRRVS